MTRLAEIEAHIGSMDELLAIVGAMRSLAGMRLQEAQRALPGIRRYAETMADGIASAILMMPGTADAAPRRPERRALILCAAEHGFVGGFNERVVEAAEAALGPEDTLFVLGSRGAAILAQRGREIAWTRAMATRVPAVPEIVRRLTGALYGKLAGGGFDRVEVMYGRHRQGAGTEAARRTLLPVDIAPPAPRQGRQPPLHNLAPAALLEKLTAEYVFARLTEAAVESLAGENAARFAAMTSARDNVSRKIEDLRRLAGQVRQTEVTEELMDVVTGAELVREG